MCYIIVYYITRGETQRLQTRVKFAAGAKRGLQPHELHSVCFVSTNVILFFIATVLRIWFSVPVKRDECAVCNPTFKVSPLRLKIAVSSRFAGTKNRIFKRGAMKSDFLIYYIMHFEIPALFAQSELATWVQECEEALGCCLQRPLEQEIFFLLDCDSDFNNCPFCRIS